MHRLLSATAVLCLAGVVSAAQEPSLRTVVDRLHSYLSEYAVRLPATIATEHYEQRCVANSRVPVVDAHAVLESEFGIMRMEEPAGWLGVRDVQSVNGRVVADRAERLQALLNDPSAKRLEQMRRIALENARFNVGPIQRTINDPAVVLAVLDASDGTRVRFSRIGDTTVEGIGVWTIKFDERRRPTLIQSTTGRDQPAKGRAWVDPLTGRLMRVELTVASPAEPFGPVTHVAFTATIVVEFSPEPRLGLWVPSKMTERYSSLPCSGEATYTNYRTFGVTSRIVPQ